jgi:outer membrane protein OmpA-like peptidoglycan-associated protein/opacity protein-like surface antigen
MVNYNLPKFLVLLALVMLSTASYAQKSKGKKEDKKTSAHQRWEIGGFLGASQYQGDVNDIGLKEINPALGGVVRCHLSDNFALRTNFLFGTLSGYDANSTINQNRGFSFKSPIRDLSLVAEYDFLGKKRFKDTDKGKFHRVFSPYIYGGLGFGSVSPDTDYNEGKLGQGGDPLLVQKDKNTKVEKGFLSVPIGLGVKYDLSKQWVLNLEASTRLTFKDYLDKISLSANPNKDDTYAFAGIIVSYRIPYVKDQDKDGVPDEADLCPEVVGTIKAKGCPDKDNDGVADRNDECPDIAGIRAMNGCPDTDRDGVADKDDECPDVIGLKELKGCPDADEDGISDKDDECPNQKGTVDYNGCPVKDSDNDGIEDKLDKCPNQKGTKEDNGCPPADTDKDGFADKDDQCPTEAGKLKGCPDKDSDNIADKEDKCPDVAGTIANQGCPEIKAEDKKVLETAIYGVQFESGKATFRPVSFDVLNQIVEIMNKYPEYNMRITGHTDSQGNDNRNLILSESRARACYAYFQSKGIKQDRMTYVGLGELRPVADNTTSEGRAKNRRVEFELFVK